MAYVLPDIIIVSDIAVFVLKRDVQLQLTPDIISDFSNTFRRPLWPWPHPTSSEIILSKN